MLYAIIILAIIALWDASRRWAERNDEYDPEDNERLWDHLHAVEGMAKTQAARTEDLAKVAANHALALESHGKTLTALGLSKAGVAGRRGGSSG